jgi:heptosyltransferase I
MSKLFKERGNVFFRFLDRYAGISLAWCLGKLRKKRPLPEGKRNDCQIILIKMSGIGDSILTIPLIRKLKEINEEGNITVICGKNNRVVYENLLDKAIIDQLICVEAGRLMRDLAYLRRMMSEVGAISCDFCIDLDPWSRFSALISYWISAGFTLGFKKENQYKHYLFDDWCVHRQEDHEFANYNRLVKPLTGNIDGLPQYPVSNDDTLYFHDFIGSRDIQDYIVLHPWASGYKHYLKELSEHALLGICNQLLEDGFDLIITGGKKDAAKTESLIANIESDHVYTIAGNTNLNETAIFLQQASCVITVNTGVLHLAAAMDCKVVSINGPTDVNRWRPLCKKAINIKSSLFCSPCLDLGFEYKCKENGVSEGLCMKKINPDDIVKAAMKLVSSS